MRHEKAPDTCMVPGPFSRVAQMSNSPFFTPAMNARHSLIGPLGVTNLHTTLNATEFHTIVIRGEARLPPLHVLMRYCHGHSLRSSRMLAMSSAEAVGLIAASRRVTTASRYCATDLASVIVTDDW